MPSLRLASTFLGSSTAAQGQASKRRTSQFVDDAKVHNLVKALVKALRPGTMWTHQWQCNKKRSSAWFEICSASRHKDHASCRPPGAMGSQIPLCVTSAAPQNLEPATFHMARTRPSTRQLQGDAATCQGLCVEVMQKMHTLHKSCHTKAWPQTGGAEASNGLSRSRSKNILCPTT